MKRRRWRRTYRIFGAGMLLAGVAVMSTHCTAVGARPTGERLERVMRSPQWHHGRFENPQAEWADTTGSYLRLLGRSEPDTRPSAPIETVSPTYAVPPASGLAVTWFGHSSALVEIDGVNVLIDPLWSARASPVGWLGPARWFAPPTKLETLPVDVVVISHDHYDHLDYESIVTLKGTRARFVVPLGIGAHLEQWGIQRERITELDWWESTQVGGLQIAATPARHASGREFTKSNRTLWAGFAFIGTGHRVWYSGDTGFHDEFAHIGERFGPFDVTLVESGQYDPNWPDVHLGPELAVEAHRRVRGAALLPVHWGALQLAPHPWIEPVERVLVAAACLDVEVLTPRPGERVEPTTHPPMKRWWPNAAWRPASQAPVIGTKNGQAAERIALPQCTNRGGVMTE